MAGKLVVDLKSRHPVPGPSRNLNQSVIFYIRERHLGLYAFRRLSHAPERAICIRKTVHRRKERHGAGVRLAAKAEKTVVPRVFSDNDHENARCIVGRARVACPVLFSHVLRLTEAVYRDTKGICQRELAVVWH